MDMKIMNKLKDGGMSNRNSYCRRDSMGRYMDNGSYRRSYEDGFSGHDIRPKLQRMMEEADSPIVSGKLFAWRCRNSKISL